jgi:hypothetical protein
MLMITSKEKADEIRVTKVYYVGDLIRTGIQRGPKFGSISNLITSNIQPDSWGDGNSGQMWPFGHDFLVFSQKQEVHDETAQLLKKLREELKARGGATNTWKDEVLTRVYSVGPVSGEQMADGIKKLVAPSTWKERGGTGEICVLNRVAPVQTQPNTAAGDVLLIRQSGEVHDQIADILWALDNGGLLIPMGGGMKNGGLSAGTGGGMFRVPNNSQPPKSE